MSVSVDYFTPFIAPDVPMCPDPVIRINTTLAAQDFFRETNLWRVECDPIQVAAGESIVDLDIPTNTMIGKIYSIYDGSMRVPHITQEEAYSDRADWMTATGTQLRGYWVVGQGSIRLYPIPEAAVTLHVHCAVVPTAACQSFDDLALQYEQAIIHGSLWKIHSAVGKPWSLPDAAAYNYNQFQRIVGDAKIRANRSGSAVLRVDLGSLV